MCKLFVMTCVLLVCFSTIPSFAQETELVPVMPDNAAEVRLLTTLVYDDGVGGVAFSPDGGLIALYSFDSDIHLWNTVTRSEQFTLTGHTGNITSVAFSLDGTLLASGSWDSTVRVWDVATGDQQAVLEGHTNGILCVAFNPVSSFSLVSEGWDNTVRVWNLETDTELATLPGHTNGVCSLALSPNGFMLAYLGEDDATHLWNISDQSEAAVLGIHSSAEWSPVFSPDGELLITEGENHSLQVWDGINRAALAQLPHSSTIGGVAFPPIGGGLLASYTNDNLGHLWNLDTGEEIATLEGHTDAINGIAFIPETSMLVTYSDDHTLRLWITGEEHARFVLEGHSSAVTDVTFGEDGRVLASTSGGNLLSQADNEIRLWDISSGAELAVLPGDANNIRHTTFSPDGATLVALSANFVKIYGIPTEARPISSVPGIIVPISVNLRAAPSLDAEIIGFVNSGTVLVGGRDETGQFVYLIDYRGWVWSDPTYIDLGSVAVEDLPVIEP